MKAFFKVLTLTSIVAGLTVSVSLQAQEPQSVGDMSSNFEPGESFVGDDLPQQADLQTNGYVGDLKALGGYVGDLALVEPADHSAPLPITESYSSAPNYSAPAARRGSVGRAMTRSPESWLSAELLLWFPEDRTSPLLVASADAGAIPLPGQPGYTELFGGSIDSGLQPGFRADAGRYFADGQLGLGARLWFLTGADESFAAGGTSGRSLGLRFFDTSANAENAFLVLLDPNLDGRLSVESELDIVASELYAKALFMEGSDYRVELVGGYSYFNIEDSLSINSSRTNTITGRVVDVRDRFEATNNFHGGQIGFQTSIHKGPISLTSLTKVHMGNMRQLVNIDGAGQRRFLGVPGVETFDTGLYTVGTEGRARQNEFAFAPEANFKLGYRMRNYVNFTVGYSFIYWNRVALSGDQFDRLVDQANFQNPLAPPPQLPTVKDRGFFVHGIDFGVTIDY